MGFLEERALAERALAYRGPEAGPAFPPTAERFAQARQRLGLSEGQVADRWGQQPSLYWDLELRDSEVFMCVDLATLPALAAALETSPMVLLFGEEPGAQVKPVTNADVAQQIRERLLEEGTTLDALGERIGWDLQPIMDDAAGLGTYNLAGVHDVCVAVGLDWVGAVASASSQARRTSA